MKDGTHGLKASSRRQFLKVGTVAVLGLVIGFYLHERRVALALQREEQPAVFAPNAFLRIGTDNLVTVISKHIEVGQGVYTGLATILAEELDAAWAQVRVEPAPADDNLCKNLRLGMQGTCCSNSIMNSFEQYRQAGSMAQRVVPHRRRAPRDGHCFGGTATAVRRVMKRLILLRLDPCRV